MTRKKDCTNQSLERFLTWFVADEVTLHLTAALSCFDANHVNFGDPRLQITS